MHSDWLRLMRKGSVRDVLGSPGASIIFTNSPVSFENAGPELLISLYLLAPPAFAAPPREALLLALDVCEGVAPKKASAAPGSMRSPLTLCHSGCQLCCLGASRE